MKEYFYKYKQGDRGGFGTVEADSITQAKKEVLSYIKSTFKPHVVLDKGMKIVVKPLEE